MKDVFGLSRIGPNTAPTLEFGQFHAGVKNPAAEYQRPGDLLQLAYLGGEFFVNRLSKPARQHGDSQNRAYDTQGHKHGNFVPIDDQHLNPHKHQYQRQPI